MRGSTPWLPRARETCPRPCASALRTAAGSLPPVKSSCRGRVLAVLGEDQPQRVHLGGLLLEVMRASRSLRAPRSIGRGPGRDGHLGSPEVGDAPARVCPRLIRCGTSRGTVRLANDDDDPEEQHGKPARTRGGGPSRAACSHCRCSSSVRCPCAPSLRAAPMARCRRPTRCRAMPRMSITSPPTAAPRPPAHRLKPPTTLESAIDQGRHRRRHHPARRHLPHRRPRAQPGRDPPALPRRDTRAQGHARRRPSGSRSATASGAPSGRRSSRRSPPTGGGATARACAPRCTNSTTTWSSSTASRCAPSSGRAASTPSSYAIDYEGGYVYIRQRPRRPPDRDHRLRQRAHPR